MQLPDHPKYHEMVTALLETTTEAAAVEKVGINRTTLYRWKKDPVFQRLVREARKELYDYSMTQVQNATAEAIQTLRDIMGSDTAQDGARVTAARTVLEHATKFYEREELEDRLDALERIMKEQTK
jgi:Helix-turn-helix of insertion element transposase